MKKLLLLSVCLVFVGVAIAAEKPVKAEKPVNLLKSLQQSNWEIGPEAYYYRYKEDGLVEQTGYFYGVQAAYTYRDWVPALPTDDSELKLMFRAEGRYDWGVVDSDGKIEDATGGSVNFSSDNKHNRIGEFRLLLGPDFPRADVVDTIYSGVGYRYLNDDQEDDPPAFDKRLNYLYLPIGFNTLRNLSGSWLFSANVEFDLLLWGKQSSDLPADDFHNKQNSGYGLRGSLGFEYTTKEMAVIFQPFIRYWNIDESDSDKAFTVPENNTTEIGLDLTFRF